MPSAALEELCDLVSDVSVKNAIGLQQRLAKLTQPYRIQLDVEYVLETFSFMNWTFAQGVWSNLRNAKLRQDLQIGLKKSLILNLAQQVSGTTSLEATAAKAVFLTEDFNSYLRAYTQQMQSMGRAADSGTARLFALEQIQAEQRIPDHLMNDVVPELWSDDEVNSEVEAVAIQVNNMADAMKPKGFLRRLFGS
ncbi:MAG: hypothetical protein U1E05_21815 [Patescibacteria group bacterium]|nr:hypothetical protein [Patescibacteria group bacterium]